MKWLIFKKVGGLEAYSKISEEAGLTLTDNVAFLLLYAPHVFAAYFAMTLWTSKDFKNGKFEDTMSTFESLAIKYIIEGT